MVVASQRQARWILDGRKGIFGWHTVGILKDLGLACSKWMFFAKEIRCCAAEKGCLLYRMAYQPVLSSLGFGVGCGFFSASGLALLPFAGLPSAASS
jgi:hypothetical protein